MKNNAQTKKAVPAYWAGKPDWFKNNDWLIENQEHLFVKRLGNTIGQISMDKNIKSPKEKPMEATKGCLMGDIASDGTRFQYKETLRELAMLTGADRTEGDKVMEEFNKEFAEYLPFLTQ